MKKALVISMFGAVTLLVGCPADGNDPAADSSSMQDTDANVATTGPAATGDGSMGNTSMDPDDPPPGTGPGIVFIEEFDGGGGEIECDIWGQDCSEGEKCNPWANDGGNSWNATKCVSVDANAGTPGDSCSTEGGGVSGLDSCASSSMCWNVDGETNLGTCVGFCTGSETSPICDDPTTACSITNDGVLILCLPKCDPLLQNCVEGEACYGIDEAYICAPDVSGEMGGQGDPCGNTINACDPGFECINAAAHTSCDAAGCCTSFCSISDPVDPCTLDAGQSCIRVFEEGAAPPGYEDVGVCAVPA